MEENKQVYKDKIVDDVDTLPENEKTEEKNDSEPQEKFKLFKKYKKMEQKNKTKKNRNFFEKLFTTKTLKGFQFN